MIFLRFSEIVPYVVRPYIISDFVKKVRKPLKIMIQSSVMLIYTAVNFDWTSVLQRSLYWSIGHIEQIIILY